LSWNIITVTIARNTAIGHALNVRRRDTSNTLIFWKLLPAGAGADLVGGPAAPPRGREP
jgi:hypothetical protein